MKYLIAADKFKGSLSAQEACEAISRGLPADAEKEICPIADGGEGFVDALLAVRPGRRLSVKVVDALGRECVAEYGLIDDDSTAVIEMSVASGLWRIDPRDRDILRSDTYGTGQMMRHAIELFGVSRILIGIGGSATNDAGVGMVRALGAKFFDASGAEVFDPVDFSRVATVDMSGVGELPAITVACDVTNPLLGNTGATAIFGPQKGATAEDFVILETALEHIMHVTEGEELARSAGAGAAGGLGWGLQHFCGAKAVPGFDLIAEALDLDNRIDAADIVVTGEGSLDEQTLDGKGPAGVALLARERGKRVIGVAGRVTDEAKPLFDETYALEDTGLPLDTLIADAATLLERIVAENIAS